MKKNIISIVIALIILAIIITGVVMVYKDYKQEKENEAMIEWAEGIVLNRINSLDYCGDIREILAYGGSIRITDIGRFRIDFDVLDYEGNIYIPDAYTSLEEVETVYYDGVFSYWQRNS